MPVRSRAAAYLRNAAAAGRRAKARNCTTSRFVSVPADRTTLLSPTAVNAILAEVRQRQADGREVVSLMRGEPDFDTPVHIVEAAGRALAQGRTRYPDNRGEPALRQAIAARLQTDAGLSYDADAEILVTTGATLGIQVALMALINPGDEVLVPDPVYDAYRSPIRLAGGTVRPIRSTIREGRFVLPAAAVAAAIGPRSRVLVLNTPWNPTGTVFSAEELRELIDVLVTHDLFLISDEIYEALTFDGVRHVSPVSASAAARARTVVVNSLSKTYAMTGWRVGYNAAPAALTRVMLLVLQQMSRGPATFVQDAATEALTAPQHCVQTMREEYARRRAEVVAALRGLPHVRVLPPQGGFFAIIDLRETGIPSDAIRRRLLAEHGVAVVHGAAYGPGGEGTLRVSFGCGGDTLRRGLDRLAEGLRGL
jgi:aspartate aminotransferase